MKILYVLLFIFSFFLEARDFKVASYNVENLFDLKYDGTEYKEYKPNTKNWHKKAFYNKIDNITKVIKDIDADVVALQEIESQEALETLLKKLPKYSYYNFLKNKSSSVGVGIISVFPIKDNKTIIVDKKDKYSRYILRSTLQIDKKELIIYTNHWRSKRAAESKRVVYALALKKDIDRLKTYQDYIIIGDLNSNYNEFQTFKYDKKLNDTFGITGINQILNTTIEKNFISKKNILSFKEKVHYNLWLDKQGDRFSSIFRAQHNTPDNIILSKGLFDKQNISYIDNSFRVFKPQYLFKNNNIIRWNKSKYKGYSDHLPIYASFSTTIQEKNNLVDVTKPKENSIKQLYEKQTVKNFSLKNVKIIYKREKMAIALKKDDKAIMIYKPSKDMIVGNIYDFVVDEIGLYNGLKEITKFSNLKYKGSFKNIKKHYLNGLNIDLFNPKYENNIVKNIKGIYKKGYFYFRNKEDKNIKIKLYFYKELKRPENGEKLTINSGHLSVYKSRIQIVLYSTKDFIKHNLNI